MPPVLPPGRTTASTPRTTVDRAAARPVPPRHDADGHDALPAGLGPAGGRQPQGRPDRAADLASSLGAVVVLTLLTGLVWHGFVFWLGANTMLLGVLLLVLMRAGRRLGRASSSTPGGSASR